MTGYQSKRAAAQDKLAQPAQEPVAWQLWVGADTPLNAPMGWQFYNTYDSLKSAEVSARTINSYQQAPFAKLVPLYTSPPQRPWVDLTKEEKQECINKSVYHTAWASDVDIGVLVDLVNGVLKEKNG